MGAEHFAASVLAWLGTYVVHSTVLLVAAWGACGLVSRRRSRRDVLPALREGFWRVALLGGLATTTAQLAFDVEPAFALWTIEAPSDHAVAPRSDSAPAVSALSTPAFADVIESYPALASPNAGPFMSSLASFAAQLDEAAPRTESHTTSTPIASTSETPAAFAWPRVLVALWLAGVALGAACWAREWFALARSLRRRLPLERGPAYDVFAQLCARTGTRGVRLSCAPGLAAPIALGLVRPEIVIPPRAVSQLAPDELEALFAHELAHVRRQDALWLVVYRAFEVVCFFQPLNRVARVRLQDEAELLADDWAVTQLPSRVSLASCLTEIAGWIVDGRRALPAPGMAARGTRLTLRVRRLLDDEHHPERARRPNALLILAGSLACGAALFVPGVAARAQTNVFDTRRSFFTEQEPELGALDALAAWDALDAPGDCTAADDAEDNDAADTDAAEAEDADVEDADSDAADASDALSERAGEFAMAEDPATGVIAPPGWNVAVWSSFGGLAGRTTFDDAVGALPGELEHAHGSLAGTLDESAALARELASLRAELARRRAPPGFARRLDALERELGELRERSRELGQLLEALGQQRSANGP